MNQQARQHTTEDGDLTIHDFLSLPEDKRRVLSWMQRQTPCSLQAIVNFLGQSEDQASCLLNELQQQGFVQMIAIGKETLYEVRLSSMRYQRRRRQTQSVFDALMDVGE
ncbi:MAG: hypothetical protein AAGE59_05565 [Cyanobacteria bacterium P01_F01_bin.86]